jgi:hypothetical protein
VLPTPTVRQEQEYATPTVMCPVRAAKARSNDTWQWDPSFLHVGCTFPASRNKYSGYPLEYSVQFEKFVIFAPQFSLSAANGRLADSSQWRAALAGSERKSQISQSGHCRGYIQTSFKKALCMPCGFDRAQQKIGADTNMHWTFPWS